ncbi:DoxX family protein [Tepidibacillus fermentans]|uniref:Thiosulfate dehydrogenase [quinone] large subunit n=1 Tax=Tepidibacillus fermentans TaxID=1281767 RepID=A0A4R3KGI7_9BACI|nr:DoxX family protein [Tepidibacillus fermentans]TCS82544.1 thiosulfate dehydrogenase [quinone] large subunit [Tepidibacillus fermentans]
MVRWLRENLYASFILLVLRLYLGWQWISAGWEKLTGDGPFDASGFLKGALQKMGGDHPSVSQWWGSFVENFALPNVGFFNFVIPWGEFLVGLGLILGCLTTAAMFFGMMMNFSFLFSGTVSHNPQMVLLSIFVIVAGYNAGRIGLDRWVIPYIRTWWGNVRKKQA